MSWESALALSAICFFAMASPGPDFIVVTRSAIAYPRKQALVTALGIAAGCLLHAGYCIVGLAVIVAQSIVVFSFIKYAGAAYLIYLGFKGLTAQDGKNQSEAAPVPRSPSMSSAFVEGFLCNALNPKCALFLLSLFTQFISPDASFLAKTQVAAIFVIESLLYWPLLVLLLQLRQVRMFFTQWRTTMDRLCGALLVALGLRVALSRN
jgi:RhtB (resistance to homoserine/threonine) family protein